MLKSKTTKSKVTPPNVRVEDLPVPCCIRPVASQRAAKAGMVLLVNGVSSDEQSVLLPHPDLMMNAITGRWALSLEWIKLQMLHDGGDEYSSDGKTWRKL